MHSTTDPGSTLRDTLLAHPTSSHADCARPWGVSPGAAEVICRQLQAEGHECRHGDGDPARLRDKAMAAAEARRGAEQDCQEIDQAIRHHASSGRPFSANTIRPMLPKVNGSLVGARFMAASRRGEIEAIGTTKASHGRGHARQLTLWRGTNPAPRPRPASEPAQPAAAEHEPQNRARR